MSEKRTEKKRNTEGESFRERVCRALDIPPDVFSGECVVEIRGRGAVSVSGGGKILLYTPEKIKISLSRGSVSICGKRLTCTSYHAGAVCIDGHIVTVTFEEE